MNTNLETVCVLMSTFNGEKYLEDQLNSILYQNDVNIKLLIRDDGSSDNTVNILKEYARKYPDKIEIYTQKNIGWKRSYFELLKMAEDADYYAYADQDDVWLPDKLSRAIYFIKEQKDDLTLYAGNVWVTDEKLNIQRPYCPIGKDMMNRPAAQIMTRSYLPGGLTFVFTPKARSEMLKLYPGGITGHDDWTFKICFCFGKVIYDSEPMVYYRQHTNNTIGASRGKLWWIKAKWKSFRYNEASASLTSRKILSVSFGNFSDPSLEIFLKIRADYPKNFKTKLKLIFHPHFKCITRWDTFWLMIKVLLEKY